MRSKLKPIVVAVCSACVMSFSLSLSHADISSDLENFYNGMGGSASVTSAGVYSGQSAGYVTLGGFNARAPIRSISPLTIQMPSIRAGCGGIDAYLGGFSYINDEQLIAMLRSIGSSALGYAFQLALATISPTIEGVLNKLQSAAQMVNSLNINSCEAGQKLVNASVTGAKNAFCWNAAQHSGRASDFNEARTKCADQAFQNDVISNSFLGNLRSPSGEVAGGGKEAMPFAGNVVWDGLMKDNYLRSDRAFAELLMSMTGTVIYPPPGGASDTGAQPQPYAAIVDYDKILSANSTVPIPVYRCSDADNCLIISPVSTTDLGVFRSKIQASVQSLVNKIINDNGTSNGALTAEEQAIIVRVKLPIVQLIQTVADISPALVDAVVQDYIGLIVADITYHYIKSTAELAETAIQKSNADPGVKESLVLKLRNSVTMAQQRRAEFLVETGGLDGIINRITLYQRKLASSMSPTMQQRLAFGRMLEYR